MGINVKQLECSFSVINTLMTVECHYQSFKTHTVLHGERRGKKTPILRLEVTDTKKQITPNSLFVLINSQNGRWKYR